MGWEKKIEKVRREHRPSLQDWAQDGLHSKFRTWVSSIPPGYQSFILNDYCKKAHNSEGIDGGQKEVQEEKKEDHKKMDEGEGSACLPEYKKHAQIPVTLSGANVTVEEFASEYESKLVPCIIQDIPQGFDGGEKTKSWDAQHKWTFEALEKDGVLCDRKFKCGEDDDGYPIKIRLKHFFPYLHKNKDDSPLYIFDQTFEDDRVAMRLLEDYTVPSYFREDLFNLTSHNSRPPYRWWLIGPERSGTTVHIDPLSTSAWNTLIVGKKRWVLFPPHVPKSIAEGRGLVNADEDDEAIHYFMYILPRIKRKAMEMRRMGNANDNYQSFSSDDSDSDSSSSSSSSSSGSSHAEHYGWEKKARTRKEKKRLNQTDPWHNFECYEFTQNAGETVFVPYGWWHAVLNLSDTIGITQNFCSRRNFKQVWIQTREGRKKLAWEWLQKLKVQHPELYKQAIELNDRDAYQMKYDPRVMAVKESDEFVANKLQEIEHEIDRLPAGNSKEAYFIALKQEIKQQTHYVRSKELLLSFLRSETFDARKAALLLVEFLKHKLELFGEEKLPRPITQDDLSEDDKRVLLSGWFHLDLDCKGRLVILFQLDLLLAAGLLQDRYINNILRVCLYQIMYAVENNDRHKNEVVVIRWSLDPTSKVSMKNHRLIFFGAARLFFALPIRCVALHQCHGNDLSRMRGVWGESFLRTYSQHLLRLHGPSAATCFAELSIYGIDVESLPLTFNGNFDESVHLQNVERMRRNEKKNDRKLEKWICLDGSGENVEKKGEQFIEKLHRILNTNHTKAIWWTKEGDSFAIHKERFADEVLPQEYNGVKMTSFLRNLKRWRFEKLKSHGNIITYQHPSVERYAPNLI